MPTPGGDERGFDFGGLADLGGDFAGGGGFDAGGGFQPGINPELGGSPGRRSQADMIEQAWGGGGGEFGLDAFNFMGRVLGLSATPARRGDQFGFEVGLNPLSLAMRALGLPGSSLGIGPTVPIGFGSLEAPGSMPAGGPDRGIAAGLASALGAPSGRTEVASAAPLGEVGGPDLGIGSSESPETGAEARSEVAVLRGPPQRPELNFLQGLLLADRKRKSERESVTGGAGRVV